MTGLRERDGSRGRVVLVFPNPALELVARRDHRRVRGRLARGRAGARGAGRSARARRGGPSLTSDIIVSMRRDGPLASGLAFLGVVATVILIFRRGLATPFVIG